MMRKRESKRSSRDYGFLLSQEWRIGAPDGELKKRTQFCRNSARVIPAKTGIQNLETITWIPAFAGMTRRNA
jgi:hypothetical protein